jgi:hypothetical protein
MKREFSLSVILLMGLMFIGCTAGQDGKVPRNTLATPEETVKAYCDLDAKGTRLTSETWSRVLPYIAWTEEAGWDRTIVIEGYKIAKTQKQSETASTVTVEYQVSGVLSGDYVPNKKSEIVTFKVKKTKEGWKITEPDFLPPHVLMQPMVKHLEGTKNLELSRKVQDAPKE